MNYASVCTGIATDSLSFPKHWTCAWNAEVGAFPSRVLKHYHPDTPNLGDMRALDRRRGSKAEYVRARPIDIITGGTPCQSFSVAGKRGGLDDHRGNLALTFARIAGITGARWILWENVPGVLSSSEGRDFGAFLGALAKRGYHLAYRVLDAQWFGVPQRRRRVYVVGYLGDWRYPAAVLFDSASLYGNPPARKKEGQGVASTITASSHRSGGATAGNNPGIVNAVVEGCDLFNQDLTGEIAHTLRVSTDNGLQSTPHIIASTLTTRCGGLRRDLEMDTFIPEITHCLTGGSFDASEDGTGRGTPLVAIGENQRGELRMMSTAAALGQGGGKPGQGYPAAMIGSRVRRLTPLECERLQGLPDNYTAIPGASDSERYAAIGNGWARPVVEWISNRIAAVDAIAAGTNGNSDLVEE